MKRFNIHDWQYKQRLLKEQACENRAKDLADDYSVQELQDRLDQIMRDMEQEAEPEGGPIADMYGAEMEAYERAISIAKKNSGKGDVPYDVAIGRMTQDEYDKMMSTNEQIRAQDVPGTAAFMGKNMGSSKERYPSPQESISDGDRFALQKIISNYDLETILFNIGEIAGRSGMSDEEYELKRMARVFKTDV